MRFWLYLGAVVLGFALMAVEDKDASERIVDAPEASSPPPANEGAAQRTPINTGKQQPDLATLRSVALEVARHGAAVAAK